MGRYCIGGVGWLPGRGFGLYDDAVPAGRIRLGAACPGAGRAFLCEAGMLHCAVRSLTAFKLC